MVRLLIRTLLALIANAVGLILSSILLDGFTINVSGFLASLVIFSLSFIILGPLITKIALRDIPALMGGIALVTTLVSLVITDVLSNGLEIKGLSTWILATLIIWLGTLLASVLLPLFLFKNILENNKNDKN
jgi:predicted neutral ceramidase superfamily lipid hydrolase